MGSVLSPERTPRSLLEGVETSAQRPVPLNTGARPPGSTSFTAWVIAAYLLIDAIAFWAVLSTTNRLFGSGSAGPGQMVWYLAWIPHAIAHGQNPFSSTSVLVPNGVNVAQNTSVPLLGVLAAPITVLFGPVTSGNLLMFLTMPCRHRLPSSSFESGTYGNQRLPSAGSHMASPPTWWHTGLAISA